MPIASPCVELLSQYQRKSLWLKTAAIRLQYDARPDAAPEVLIVRTTRTIAHMVEAAFPIIDCDTNRQNYAYSIGARQH